MIPKFDPNRDSAVPLELVYTDATKRVLSTGIRNVCLQCSLQVVYSVVYRSSTGSQQVVYI